VNIVRFYEAKRIPKCTTFEIFMASFWQATFREHVYFYALGGGAGGAVVATDSVSAHADCDNGTTFQPLPRPRGCGRDAADRVEVEDEGHHPGYAATSGANLYARRTHVVLGLGF
jgi:hypothetical protein